MVDNTLNSVGCNVPPSTSTDSVDQANPLTSTSITCTVSALNPELTTPHTSDVRIVNDSSPTSTSDTGISPLEAFSLLKHTYPSYSEATKTGSVSNTESGADVVVSIYTEELCLPEALAHPESPISCEEDEFETNVDIHPPNWLDSPPKLVSYAEKDYISSKCTFGDNYLRGCGWSPDGSCILTNSRDNVLRLFNLPNVLLESPSSKETTLEEMHAVLSMREHELVYDYSWYPRMNSCDPSTCCFASAVRRNPIRLWDAFTGGVRATYRPISHLGELISPYSIAFSSDGLRLYAGFNRFIHVFDVSRPGTDSVRRPKLGKKPFQGGMISSIAVPRDSTRQIYATGSYNGSVAMFAEPGNLIGRVQGCQSGVTQVMFSTRLAKETGAPWYLVAGGRMDSRIFLWDARQLANPILVLHRRVENHQRFQFDIDRTGQYLFTGNQTGMVCIYDLAQCQTDFNQGIRPRPSVIWRAHSDSAHGLSINPALPVLATCSGQRRIPFPRSTRGNSATDSHDSSDDSEEDPAHLADDEASILPDLTEGPAECPLPFAGKLTRLPCENRLNLWMFSPKPID